MTIIEGSSYKMVNLMTLRLSREFQVTCIFDRSQLIVKYISPLSLETDIDKKWLPGVQRFHCFFTFEFGKETSGCVVSLS
jgi:hypothetical protein